MEKSTGPILINGPHAADLAVRSMDFVEELSAPFTFTLDVLSDKHELDPKAFLGEPMTVTLLGVKGEKEGSETKRFFSGWVSEFYVLGGILEFTLYRIVLRPWLWFLQNASDCRTFVDKTIPEIVLEIFRKHGIADFDPKMTGKYQRREYVVQYRESDFNFVSRLMEAEGIHYFFRHLETKHELVMCDAVVQHKPTPGYTKLPYMHAGDRRRFHLDHIHSWQTRHRVVSGKVKLNDFDFLNPIDILDQIHEDPEPHGRGDFLVFDYPGGYDKGEEGLAIAKRRLEEIKTSHEVIMGESNARGLTVGSTYTLEEHPMKPQNREYLLVSMRGTLASHELTSSASAGHGEVFRCQFTCLPTSRPFRPARRTPCPVIHGAQTARVVGPIGKEFCVDEHGRVKVVFFWDLRAKWEGETSCWVRVSQLWAGPDYGGMHIPRVGHEVIVEFLEGDPDKPIITGRVYNGENHPPYKLDDNATQSGIKSRSMPDGLPSNFNEIRFEDKKGKEDLFIHAENTQTTTVKGSQTISVGGSRTVTVTKEDTEKYEDKREMTVTKTNVETIKELHTANYNKGRTVNIDHENDNLTVSFGNVKTDVSTGTYTLNVPVGAYKVTHKGSHEVSLAEGVAKITNGESELTMTTTTIDLYNMVSRLKLDGGNVTLKSDSVTIESKSVIIKCGENQIEIGASGVTVKGLPFINLNP